MIEYIITALIGLPILLILAWKWYFGKYDAEIYPITGPPNYPLIGTMHIFKNKDVYEALRENVRKFGGNFRACLLGDVVIVSADPDLIEFALTSNKTVDKGDGYKYFHNWLGLGLLTSAGEKWRKRRKMITPAYHFTILEQFIEVFDKNCNVLIEKLQKQIGKEIDIYPFINLCALDIICETAMGTIVNAQMKSNSEFVQATKEMNRIIMNRGFEILKSIDATYKFTADYKKEMEAVKILHQHTTDLIEARRDELLKNAQNQKESLKGDDDDEFIPKRKDNFLDILLKSTIDGKGLTNEEIRAEVDTFTFGGHDTSTSAMSFALHLISMHPEVQQRLLEEQNMIYGNNASTPTKMSDLKEMKYLEMVIKESLRLYPSASLISRTVGEDCHFRESFLRKGTEISIFSYELHRNAKIFPEPDKFIPERFLPENQAGRHPFAYIPFSAGNRNCIGQKFAMLEMKTIISKLVRNFEILPLTPPHKPIVTPGVVITSKNGILIKLNTRKYK